MVQQHEYGMKWAICYKVKYLSGRRACGPALPGHTGQHLPSSVAALAPVVFIWSDKGFFYQGHCTLELAPTSGLLSRALSIGCANVSPMDQTITENQHRSPNTFGKIPSIDNSKFFILQICSLYVYGGLVLLYSGHEKDALSWNMSYNDEKG